MEKQIIKYKKYISNSENQINGNVDLIVNELNKKQTILEVAPTGTGKTNLILEVFKRMNKNNTINILCTSNRQPAEQLYKKGISINIGGISFSYYINKDKTLKDNCFCFVYDKITDIETYLLEYQEKGFIINLIIDEAHLLINQYDFRSKCINEVIRISNLINGTTILMTGTPKTLRDYFHFDKEIIFIDDDYKCNVETMKIIINNSNCDDNTFFVSELLKYKKAFIRLNSSKEKEETEVKKIIDILIKELNRYCKNSIYVSSKDKTKSKDGKYINQMYKEVIENETLINGYDYYFCTSIFDQAINITNFDEDITPVFIVNNPQNMNLDNIQQFINRFRKNIKECIILISKSAITTEQYKIKPIKEIYNNLLEENQILLKEINNVVNNFNCPLSLKNNIIDSALKSNEYRYIIKNESNYYLDMLGIYKKSVDQYNSQYYYNYKELERELKERLNNNVICKLRDICTIHKVEPSKNQQYFKKIFEEVKTFSFDDYNISIIKDNLLTHKSVWKVDSGNPNINNLFMLETISKNLKRGFELNIPVNKMIKIIQESKTQEDFKYFVDSVQVVNINKNFLKYRDIEKILNPKCENSNAYDMILFKIHKYFIKKFYNADTDKIKQSYLTDEVIISIADELKISKLQVKKYVKMFFKTQIRKDRNNLLLIVDLKTQVQ